MNKLKNIGISALAGTLVSLSAAQAGGVSVSGVYELSYTNLNHDEVAGNKLGVVQESVVKSIRLALEGGYELKPTEYFIKGDKVEVIEGPMKGMKGIVSNIKGKEKLVIKT